MVVIVLSASLANPVTPMREATTSAIAVERIIACGFRPEDVQAAFASELQGDAVTITARSQPSAEQYACVANTAYETGYYLDVRPPFSDEYWRVFSILAQKRGEAEARERLNASGLLDKVPQFDGNNLSAVAERVETICGIVPRSTLTVSGEDVSLRMENLTTRISDSQFTCMMDSLSVAGVKMGFAGNGPEFESALEPLRRKP